MLRKLFITSIVGILVLCLLFAYYLFSPKTIQGKYFVEIKAGDTFTAVIREFKRDGILSETRSIIFLADVLGLDQKMQAGNYQFANSTNIYNILYAFSYGRVVLYKFTILEGETIKDIQKSITKSPQIKKTDYIKNNVYGKFCGVSVSSNEGLFYPDTYYINKNTNENVVLDKAYKKLNTYFTTAWKGRAQNLPYKNPYEALIMASIIERETSSKVEKPIVASVFINRLNKNMRLQACSTVIYGLGDKFQGALTNKDLKKDTKFNTYRVNGLPPTPICCPSKSSIMAALHPKNTKYLFFVVDVNGKHSFSERFKDHVISANIYRKTTKYRNELGDLLYSLGAIN